MKQSFVRHQDLLSFLVIISGVIILSSSCNKSSSYQSDHDHKAYHAIHYIPEPIHIDPSQIETVKNIDENRKAFIASFLPLIQSANQSILNQRNLMKEILNDVNSEGSLNPKNMTAINTLLFYYRLAAIDSAHSGSNKHIMNSIDSLMLRIDVIPAKIAMAQAIIESGWGSSRFCHLANNYFGVHCYSKGCGVKPQHDQTSNFEVKKYHSKLDAIKDYLRILNTGFAYVKLRKTRANARVNGEQVSPEQLAETLGSYSEKGNTYIDLIKDIMHNYVPENMDELLKE